MAKESKSAAKNTSEPKQDEGKMKALNLAMEQITKPSSLAMAQL